MCIYMCRTSEYKYANTRTILQMYIYICQYVCIYIYIMHVHIPRCVYIYINSYT